MSDNKNRVIDLSDDEMVMNDGLSDVERSEKNKIKARKEKKKEKLRSSRKKRGMFDDVTFDMDKYLDMDKAEFDLELEFMVYNMSREDNDDMDEEEKEKIQQDLAFRREKINQINEFNKALNLQLKKHKREKREKKLDLTSIDNFEKVLKWKNIANNIELQRITDVEYSLY
jgi:MinD-like ATPase involved in chromosome partitioning or flagellar assembly